MTHREVTVVLFVFVWLVISRENRNFLTAFLGFSLRKNTTKSSRESPCPRHFAFSARTLHFFIGRLAVAAVASRKSLVLVRRMIIFSIQSATIIASKSELESAISFNL